MNMNNRKYIRYHLPLKVEAKSEDDQSAKGIVKDFSRNGLRILFDSFDFLPPSILNLKIQRPGKEIFVPAIGEVTWKTFTSSGWEVGVRLRDFSPQVKAEILEHAYRAWLSQRSKYK